MASACAKCGGENDPDATACFTCGEPLVQTIRLGQMVDGRFEIRDRLGRGGMGAVYRAFDRKLEEEVALKVLREDVSGSAEARRRFITEIKLARKVIHRNVCRIFEYGEDAGLTYIAMELIEGTDLKQLVARAGQLPPREAFAIAIQVADGLEAIHHVGVIHRDLKASNIMIDGTGAVRLMDFGIAKEAAQDATGATATGHVVGTPSCMSPEQARGDKVDFRSDIYSLGVVIFELFAGQPLFDAETPLGLLMKHIHEAPPLTGPRAARLPASLVPVLRIALEKAREARYPSAAAFSAALRSAMEESSATELTADGTEGTLEVGTGARIEDHPTEAAQTAVAPGNLPTRESTRVAPTVALPPRPAPTPATKLRLHPAIGGVAALVVLGTIGYVLSPRPAVDPAPPTPSPAPTASPSTGPVGTPVEVRVSASPWARVRVTPAGEAPQGFTAPAPLVTPCVLSLPPGRYSLAFENDGLTKGFEATITVEPGEPNAFSFTMPGFDAARAARAAADAVS